jgi:hypothetical protein
VDKLGKLSLLLVTLTGCTQAREAKLRHEIQCRTYADKDLADIRKRTGGSTSATLEESFYSERMNTCVAAIRENGSNEDFKGKSHWSISYSLYEAVSNKKIAWFVQTDNGSYDASNGEDAIPMKTDAKAAFEEKLKEWR